MDFSKMNNSDMISAKAMYANNLHGLLDPVCLNIS